MQIGFLLSGKCKRARLNKIIAIDPQSPVPDTYWCINAGNNILREYISTVVIPYMRMEGVIDKDIILYDSSPQISDQNLIVKQPSCGLNNGSISGLAAVNSIGGELQIKWVNEKELKSYMRNTFPSIVDVLQAGLPV